MKLAFWKIPGLATHQGFAILDVVGKPGTLIVNLQNFEGRTIKIKLTFRGHVGFMACDEFGMERFVTDSPARQGLGGANFFLAEESEFKALLSGGSMSVFESEKLTSYVLVDSDHWIEVLATESPEIVLEKETLK
jgi:hypothetical protein